MLNYEDLIGDILSYVSDEKVSECNNDFLEINGFKRYSEGEDDYIFYSFIKEEDDGEETLHTIALELLTGDVIYTDNGNIVEKLDEPCYVGDLSLDMQERIYTELNRSIARMIRDLNK